MEIKQFKAESKRLLDLMINSIYTHREIFLRELISNASDAIDKIYYKSLGDDNINFNKEDFFIKISIDKENRTIKISDTGIGMTKNELEDNLGVIAKSGSLQFKKENEIKDGYDIIGQFGVGFYSSFLIADKVTVITKTFGSNEAYKWESTGVEGYTIEPATKNTIGTDIILQVKPNTEDENFDEYLNEYKIQSLIKKYELENANCDIAAQAFKRDSTLFVGNAATMIEYEQAKSLLIQKKVSLMTNIAEIENIRIQKSQLSHALIENTDQSIEKENLLIKDMETAFKNMRTELNQWIQNFAIVAPYEGKASFSKYWSIGQYVTPGEEVMTIIPVENQLVGKLLLPTAKSGKVKIGQKVSIKLDSYPYMEFGLVQGIVQAISLMPYEKNYLVDVSLPHGLRTNYGKTLQFSQEMPGTADIITEEMTLFDRIYNPIRSILVNIKK